MDVLTGGKGPSSVDGPGDGALRAVGQVAGRAGREQVAQGEGAQRCHRHTLRIDRVEGGNGIP